MSGLSMEHVNVAYGRHPIIHDLSVGNLRRGEVTALLGPNGSGKSTLLKAIAGLIRMQGRIFLDNHDLTQCNFAQRAEKVVYLPQSLPASVHLRVLESLLVAKRASGEAVSSDDQDEAIVLMKRLGIAHLALHYLDQLSGGQKQLVGLAQALIRQPALLLLDEPLSALDLNFQFHVMDLLRQETLDRQIITLIVLHDLNIALRQTDHVLMLKQGRLVANGKPEKVIAADVLCDVYGVKSRIEHCSLGYAQLMVDGLADNAQKAILSSR